MAVITSIFGSFSSISSNLLQSISLQSSAVPVTNDPIQKTLIPQDIITPGLPGKAKAAEDIKQYQKIDKAASDGLAYIRNSLQQLASLAEQASEGSLSTSQQTSLNNQFQSEYKSLQKFVANDSADGQKLFTGTFSLNAGSTLGKYLFTGAANAPNQAQATLSLPNISASLGSLSVNNSSNAASALTSLENTLQSLNPVAQNIGDFNSALTFASNTLQGKPNNGASITQEDALGQATQVANVAAAGISDITSLVQQLQGIATEAANPALSSAQLGFLNQQFGAIFQGINNVVNNFKGPDGTAVLNGTLNDNIGGVLGQYLFTGAANAPTPADADLIIGNLGTSGLFGNSLPDVSTQSDAQNALTALASALQKLNGAATAVGNFEYALSFAANNISKAGNISATLSATTVTAIAAPASLGNDEESGVDSSLPADEVATQTSVTLNLLPEDNIASVTRGLLNIHAFDNLDSVDIVA